MPKSLGLSIVIGSAVAGAVSGIKSVATETNRLGKTIDDISSKRIEIIENDAQVVKYKDRISTLSKTIDHLYARRKELQIKRDLAKSDEEAQKFTEELRSVNGKIRLLNSQKIKLKDQLNGAKIAAQNTNREFLRLGKTIENLGRYQARLSALEMKRERFRSKLIDTIAIGATVAYPVKKAIEFESAMADVAKVANLSQSEIKAFGSEMTTLSAKIPIAADGLAAIAASGAQLGIAKNRLTEFTKIVAKMSTAFDMGANEAGESVAKLMNVYDLSLSQVTTLGDALNHLSDNTAAKAKDMVNVLSRIGGTAKMFGLAATQSAALADAFLAMGKGPEVASTAINSLLNRLQTADKQGKKFQDALARIGTSSADIKLMIQNDPQKAIISVLKSIKALDKQEQMGVLTDMFGTEFADDIALLVSGLDNYKKALALTAKESEYAGSMQREFENRSKTTANQLKLLGNSLNRIGIALGSVLLPPMQTAAEALAGFFNKVAALNEEFPLAGKAISYAVIGLGTLAATSAVVGYGFTFLIGGFTRLQIGFTMLTNAAKLFGVALRMSPVGIAVTAIVALGGAIVWAYNKFDWFRNGVNTVWEWIKKLFSFSPLGLVVKAWQPVFDFLSGKFEWIGKAIDGIKSIGSEIAGFFGFSDEKEPVAAKPVRNLAVASAVAATASASGVDSAMLAQRGAVQSGPAYTININVTGTNASPEEIARAVRQAIEETRQRGFEDDR